MYTRYKIVEKQNETCYFGTPVFNLVSLVLGLVGCIGMGIVANFQDYVYHVVSAICEWTVAFGFIFYFLTFIQDFQPRMSCIRIMLVAQENNRTEALEGKLLAPPGHPQQIRVPK
ncbi:DNA damage-regulated autophagy modulator protein 1 [Cricetulus griseus]|uniref:DNA damage-regulated autophagy modulator protein 1 n=1 Tax=Cricetulus griseus TaxID=10029 RepID=G3H677_CRIGR|nr:DNA damage-regulated autophagy modulator protein 1 [Cricetulus griseus]ERE89539.1 DNA damage-regulated autophagy modulator protein 1 [Cricetulus griseus]